MNKRTFAVEVDAIVEKVAVEHQIHVNEARDLIIEALRKDRNRLIITRRQRYERKTIDTLKFYVGRDGLGVTPRDVEQYVGRRICSQQLTKEELVNLLMGLDKDGLGLGDLLS